MFLRISMDAIYICNRLNLQSDYSFITREGVFMFFPYVSLHKKNCQIHKSAKRTTAVERV